MNSIFPVLRILERIPESQTVQFPATLQIITKYQRLRLTPQSYKNDFFTTFRMTTYETDPMTKDILNILFWAIKGLNVIRNVVMNSFPP